MIAKILNLTRPLILPDTETTGLGPEARIIEIAHQVYRPDGEVKEWRSLINPEMPIPEAATKVHGITNADLSRCQRCNQLRDDPAHPKDHEFHLVPTFKQVAANLARGYSNCDFAGKNVRFDLEKFAQEFARVGVAWNYAGARIIDADRLEALIYPRDLSTLYERRIGKKMENAHSALFDVRATGEVLAHQLEERKLPLDLQALHDLSWPGFIDAEGKMRFKHGVAVLSFGMHRDKPLEQVPRSYWEWVMKGTFSSEFKSLAERCMRGDYPRPNGTVRDEQAF